MAVSGSSGALFNPNNAFFEAIDLDRQAANQANAIGYSSDFVEQQLGGVGKMPIIFEEEEFNATEEYFGLAGINIPFSISGLPDNLGYMRSAAFSIAESYGQLQNKSDKFFTNDQIAEMIIRRVVQLFLEEIARIEEYMNQENGILKPELEKKFERHLESLNYYMDVLSGNLGVVASENARQATKGNYEQVLQAA